MNPLQQTAWNRFLKTGAVSDYMQYRRICALGLEQETSDELMTQTEGEEEKSNEGFHRRAGYS